MSFLNIFDTETASNRGAEMILLHPVTGEPVYFIPEDEKEALQKQADAAIKKDPSCAAEWEEKLRGETIGIYYQGPDSDIYTRHIQSKVREIRRQQAKGKKEPDVDLEKTKLEAAELYSKLATGWRNMPSDDGKSRLPYSKENLIKTLLKYKEILVQSGNWIGKQENFIIS